MVSTWDEPVSTSPRRELREHATDIWSGFSCECWARTWVLTLWSKDSTPSSPWKRVPVIKFTRAHRYFVCCFSASLFKRNANGMKGLDMEPHSGHYLLLWAQTYDAVLNSALFPCLMFSPYYRKVLNNIQLPNVICLKSLSWSLCNGSQRLGTHEELEFWQVYQRLLHFPNSTT